MVCCMCSTAPTTEHQPLWHSARETSWSENGMDSKPVILTGSLGKGHKIVNVNRKPIHYKLGEHITESFSQLIQGKLF